MIVHDVIQGSSAWMRLRMGIPTASEFHNILTPTGKQAGADTTRRYACELIAEWLMQRPLDGVTMPWMQRGKDLEEKAAEFYEFVNDVETKIVGFITNDAGTIGASPDRLVGDDGLLEIKVPSHHQHIEYLLFKDISKRYKPQLQGQLYVTGRQWVDIVSFHPEMPPAIVRVERDEEYIKILDVALQSFTRYMAELREGLRERNIQPAVPVPEEPMRDIITEEDLELILRVRREKQHEIL